jgi:DNA-binding response OmpR family regulator
MLGVDGSVASERRALKAGADGFVAGPIEWERVQLRAEALLRQASGRYARTVTLGAISIDFSQQVVRVRGTPIALTPMQYRLLTCLAEAGGTVSHRQIAEQVLEARGGDEHSIRDRIYHLVSRLLPKLAPADCQLVTIPGFGYELRALARAS